MGSFRDVICSVNTLALYWHSSVKKDLHSEIKRKRKWFHGVKNLQGARARIVWILAVLSPVRRGYWIYIWDFFPICSFLDISLSYLEFHPLYLYIAAKCSLAIKRHALKFVEWYYLGGWKSSGSLKVAGLSTSFRSLTFAISAIDWGKGDIISCISRVQCDSW
jgi:hypothetical protein